ncbi:hypothetical protein EDB84DRAFT_938760 [Lactarius hengduanensis]|nr:hypothetical protein EDB84DRAFT_938760 [Lactarius hengduanensis]
MAHYLAHYDIFRDQLAIKYRAFGHALWEPDPGGQYPPAEVGDVGFIREGKFHRLFNALLTADHPSHERFGAPEYHEPLLPTVPDHIDRGVLNPNNFCSHGVAEVSGRSNFFAVEPPASAEVSFTCSRKLGAVLALPVTAQREDTLAQGDFATWMTRHIDSWFTFARRLGLGIEQMQDLVLVTGRHRTRSWSNIAFYESQADAQVSFGVQVSGHLGAGVNWQVSSRQIQGAILSHGPSGENLPEDQSIFVRGFRVKRAFKIFPPRLRGAAGSAPDSSWGDGKPDSEMEVVSSIPSVTDSETEVVSSISSITNSGSEAQYRDPLHILLEYIASVNNLLRGPT